MQRNELRRWTVAAVLALALGGVGAAEHSAIKRPFDLPPSADLTYSIKARQRGFSLNGEAVVNWKVAGGKYQVLANTRASFLGKILENHSEGSIDSYGLAPATFYEKRFRKDPWTTTFNRDNKTITFTESKESYPIKGGEQDRTSVSWQLVAQVRAAPEKFVPGSEWIFFVAGRRDAEPWKFKVIKQETVQSGLGQVEALHFVKAPPPDSKDQALDIWLAPEQEWYPVKLRFTDSDDDFVEQTLEKIVKK